jgi:hypothetical protein
MISSGADCEVGKGGGIDAPDLARHRISPSTMRPLQKQYDESSGFLLHESARLAEFARRDGVR